jgi:hypothetical protein
MDVFLVEEWEQVLEERSNLVYHTFCFWIKKLSNHLIHQQTKDIFGRAYATTSAPDSQQANKKQLFRLISRQKETNPSI